MCPTTQPTMAVMIIFVAYESTVYMALQHVTKVFVKVTLLFCCVYTEYALCVITIAGLIGHALSDFLSEGNTILLL